MTKLQSPPLAFDAARGIPSGRLQRRFAAASLAMLLAGCASFDGQAVPVLRVADAESLATELSPKTALETFYAETDAGRRKLYRDRVIGTYMAGADAQYLDFRAKLSREMKGSNLALGLLALGLTGGASIAGESAANILSAGAAGAIGARASVSKELWFEKTLPALMTAMAAKRTTIRTQIMVRMRESADTYSLAEAFSDIARYQEAASLDGAVETVTTAVAAKNVEADALYANEVAFYTPPPEVGVADLRRTTKRALAASLADETRINAAATAVGVSPGVDTGETMRSIMRKMLQDSTAQGSQTFATKVQSAL